MPLCGVLLFLLFLHGTWYAFVPHAVFTAYLARLVCWKREADVDPTRVHISKDQDDQYWRLMGRGGYYLVLMLGVFFGLVYSVSHMYVRNPQNILNLHKLMAGWFGPVFAHSVKYH